MEILQEQVHHLSHLHYRPLVAGLMRISQDRPRSRIVHVKPLPDWPALFTKAKTVIEKVADFMIEAGLFDTIEFSANCFLFTTIPACRCSSCDTARPPYY